MALVLNVEGFDEDEIEERREIVPRILSTVAYSGWLLSLAIPDVVAWVMADPKFKAAAAGIADWLEHPLSVRSLQEYHER